MPTNTYVALDKVTVGTAVSTVNFTSISSAYTDLVLVAAGTCSAGSYLTLRFNSDTTTNYSTTELYGDGTTAASVRNSNNNYMYIGAIRTTQSNIITQIQNYSNATTYKTVLSRTNNAATETKAVVGLWRATPAAITSIEVGTGGANTFQTGTTFSLYGIAAAATGTAKATGGYIAEDANYYYHLFTGSGTFTALSSFNADMLVVAGGGAGGGERAGGGGGAGGLLAFTSQALTATNYTVTVGAGGAGVSGNRGGAGTNSQFAALTASVGGGGGGGAATKTGGNGGSGGGGLGFDGGGSNAGGTATSGQGNAGSASAGSVNFAAGGGGGATAAGQAVTPSSIVAAAGGAGSSAYSSWGAVVGAGQNVNGTYYFAGGGGGGGSPTTTPGAGGLGGGSAGGVSTFNPTDRGIASTGGGGGGSGLFSTGTGSNGGSGVVIIRYTK